MLRAIVFADTPDAVFAGRLTTDLDLDLCFTLRVVFRCTKKAEAREA